MTAEISAVDFSDFSLAADFQATQARGHGFAQFVRQHEGRLILNAEISGQREHALALHLVAEQDDRQEIGFQWQLMRREQRARGQRKVAAAGLTSSAQMRAASTIIAGRAAAARTYGLTIGRRPPQARENIRRASVRHAHDLADAERSRSRR